MKKIKPWMVVILLLGLAVAVKFWLFPPASQGNTTRSQINAAVSVQAELVKEDVLNENLHVGGTLISNESVSLQAESSGKVTGIFFTEGTQVIQGQLLVKLNDAELQAGLKKTEARLKLALDKMNRLKKLLDINGISKDEFETAVNEYQSLQGDVEITNAQIAKTEIRAPFNGIAGLKNISVGSFVSPGTEIANIEQSDPIKLDILVPEKYTQILRTGTMVEFTVENSEKVYKAVIYATDPKIDAETRSLKIRAKCSNPGLELKSGSFARVKIVLNEKNKALSIPTHALIPELNGKKVYVIENGTVAARLVKTGLRSEDRIEITDGLAPGDSVITNGVTAVKPGSKVKVVPQ